MIVPVDQEARTRIESQLDRSMIVEAAAGTGKTTILVRRLVEVLASGNAEIHQIVAVTFTRKAAGELKLRLRQALDEARSSTDRQRAARLTEALKHLEEASIGTIHSFCAEILRTRPVEAEIDPSFAGIDEEEAERLFDRAFRRWVESALERMPDGLGRALSRLASQPSFDGASPIDRLRGAGRVLREWRDYPAAWESRPFDRNGTIDSLVGRVGGLAELYDSNQDARDPLRQALAPAWRLGEWVRRSEAVAVRDYDALEARLTETLRELKRQARRKGRGSWPIDGISRAEVVRRRDDLIDTLESFKRHADAELAVQLRTELGAAVASYDELKHNAGQLDFLDLLIRARDVIRDNPEVRRHLQAAYTHVFVDEFQDTDPLQVEILLLLTAGDPGETDWRKALPAAGKLFLVGDPKQSIYRFRRADVALYEQVKARLRDAGVQVEYLTHSFRSVASLQATVNAAFAREMAEGSAGLQPEYVPLEGGLPDTPGQAAVVAIPVPRPYGTWGRITRYRVEEQQPQALGAWIDWLLHQSGWQVRDPDSGGAPVAVEPRHVAILFRRFMSWRDDVTRPYLSALEARGIPHLLSGGRSFHQREEVGTLRAALNAIEWPDDELSVFATLKGSLFAIADAELLTFRERYGRLHPFRPVPDELEARLEPIAESLGVLAELHQGRNRRPVTATVQELLRRTRSHAGFAMRPAGNQVLANVQRVVELARAFELGGGLSFRGFVQRIGDEAERPGSGEAPVLEEGADGVRIMTVHGAKGLEFPVVVLADMTAQLARAEPSTHIDPDKRLCATRLLGCAPWELLDHAESERQRDRAEAVRLAYVATTRARDLLVVPALGEYPWDDGWVSPLNPALYPARESFRRGTPATGLGCPEFGDRTVLERPQRAHGETESSIRPGLHTAESGTGVVWWDPAALDLDVPYNFGLRQEELLGEDSSGEATAEGHDAYTRWGQRRSRLLERGARRQIDVVVVSEARAGPPEVRGEVAVEHVARDADRPAGRRFGTLVHTVLRDVEFDADRDHVAQLVRFHARVLGAPASEVDAAIVAVGATLQHPLVRRAAAAPVHHREMPFIVPVDATRVADGVVDLLFQEGESWTVVDFKTDARTADLLDRYRAQADWYVWAIGELLGQPTKAVLLSV